MRKDALALLAGVTAIQFAPSLPTGWLVAAGALPLLLPLAWRSRWRWLCFLLLGLIYACYCARLDLDHSLPPASAPLAVNARIRIDSLVERGERGAAFDARILDADLPLRVRRVRIDWYRPPSALQSGQTWRLALTLKRTRGLRNPGGFDAQARWLRQGIDALGVVSNRAAPRLLEAGSRWTLLRVRESLAARLVNFAAGSPSAGVIAGLAVGDTSRIAPDAWSLFRALGITHLMAISGTHVGMFGLLAAALTRRTWRCTRRPSSQRGSQLACTLSAIVGSTAYALLAGFSIPSQRTALMIAVAGLARLRGRHMPPSQSLALALVAVLLLDPSAGVQAGFWLSFGAVAWIVALEAGAAQASPWRAALRLQVGVTLLVLPITLYCFGQASLIAAPVNLIAVPLTGLVLVPLIVLAAVLVVPAPAAAHWLIRRLSEMLDHLWPALQALADWPFAQWWSASLPLAAAVAATLAAAALGLLPALQGRFLAATAMFLVLEGRPARPAVGGFELTLLEAGDATLAVVLTHESTIVYFAGSGSAWSADVGASVLVPYLRYRGRRRVDLLVISRADGAHAAGLDAVFRELPVLQMFAGADPSAPCVAGERLDRDGVQLRMLNPPAEQMPGPGSSCVLWLATARASVLLAGEMDQKAEQRSLERDVPGPATLVVVPARGSHHASSLRFVAALRPRWALIAAAHLGRFGYPRAEVIARWQAAGAEVRQVSLEGAITMTAPAQGPVGLPPGERLAHPRFWSGE